MTHLSLMSCTAHEYQTLSLGRPDRAEIIRLQFYLLVKQQGRKVIISMLVEVGSAFN